MHKPAVTSVQIHELLANRWSPRGFKADYKIPSTELTAMLEAARWAPSSTNSQPWKFAVAHKGDALFTQLVETLSGYNKSWAPNASNLIVCVTETVDSAGAVRHSAEYDLGLSVSALATQATALGLAVHQIGGFSASKVREVLELAPELKPVVLLAIGLQDDEADLDETLRSREVAPRVRKPLDEILLNPSVLA